MDEKSFKKAKVIDQFDKEVVMPELEKRKKIL